MSTRIWYDGRSYLLEDDSDIPMGISPGETVIVRGIDKDGDRVTIHMQYGVGLVIVD